MNRHIIIRFLVAVLWIAGGIVCTVKSMTTQSIISYALGVAFAISAFVMLKNGKDK